MVTAVTAGGGGGAQGRKLSVLAYVVAGSAMGGLLDVVAFDRPTPFEGFFIGAVVAALYVLVLRTSGSRPC